MPTAGEIRAALDRVLGSHIFRAAHGQRRFLKFVVEETLAGHGQSLKEFTVGVGAFERGESFDPRLDPIVRTEARKLRARLAKYYAEEGPSDPVRIELPKGSYQPVFLNWVPSPAAEAQAEPELVAEVEPEMEPEVELATGAEIKAEIGAVIKPEIEAEIKPAAAVAIMPVAARPARWQIGLGLGAVVLAGVLLVAVRHRLGVAEPASAVTAPPVGSVAVLPIANLSGDRKQDLVTEGLTASLIDLLTREPGLRVVARTSSFRLGGTDPGLSQVKAQLGADSVLKGTLERFGESLRLRVRLEGGGGENPLWSGSFTFRAPLDEALEAEIAAEVVHVLRTRRPHPAPTALAAGRVVPAAYGHYLEGLRYSNEFNAVSLATAADRLSIAVREDPLFARAHAALANVLVMEAQISGPASAEVRARVRQLALRALQLDSALGEAHFSLAVCAQYEYDWATAEKEFRRGLELSPSSALGHLWYARYLALTGRHREVLVHRTIGAELDPLSPYAIQAVGGYWSVMGEYDQAIGRFQQALALAPRYGYARQGLGMAYLLKGEPVPALAELEQAANLQGGIRTRALLGYAYGVTHRTAQARAILAEFLERQRREPSFPALAIAHVYLGLGEKDHAFEWLERAIDQRDLSVTLQWDSLYVPLRSDVRYTQLLRRMRLS